MVKHRGFCLKNFQASIRHSFKKVTLTTNILSIKFNKVVLVRLESIQILKIQKKITLVPISDNVYNYKEKDNHFRLRWNIIRMKEKVKNQNKEQKR